jgi:hypothetical protein
MKEFKIWHFLNHSDVQSRDDDAVSLIELLDHLEIPVSCLWPSFASDSHDFQAIGFLFKALQAFSSTCFDRRGAGGWYLAGCGISAGYHLGQ